MQPIKPLRSPPCLLATALFALLAVLPMSSAQAVDQPPVLGTFANLVPEIDPTAGIPSAQFLLGLTDAAPGICTTLCEDNGAPSQLTLVHPPTGQRRTSTLGPTASSDQYIAVVTLDAASAGSDWIVESVWLADRSGNRRFLSTEDLVARGFDVVVTNLATGGDTTSPALASVLVSSTSIDSTAGAQVVVELSPYESGLCRAPTCPLSTSPSQIRFVHAGTGQVRSAFVRREIAVVGGLIVFRHRARIEFPHGSAGGQWQLEWASLVDVAGNRRTFDAAELAALGAQTVENTSTTGDSAPPTQTLVDRLPRPTIDTTGGPVTALFGIEAFDEGRGLCAAPDACDDFGGVTQVIYKRDGADHRRFAPLTLAGTDIYLGSTVIPESGAANVWRPDQLMLVDRAGNRMIPEPTLLPALLVGVTALATHARRRVASRGVFGAR